MRSLLAPTGSNRLPFNKLLTGEEGLTPPSQVLKQVKNGGAKHHHFSRTLLGINLTILLNVKGGRKIVEIH